MHLLLGLPLGIFRLLGGILMGALRLLPLIILGLIAFFLWRKHRHVAKEMDDAGEPEPRAERRRGGPSFTGPVVTVDYKEVREEDVSGSPERPAPFGHKPGWLAIRCDDPEAVMDALGLRERSRANWTAGLAGVSGSRWFVSPALDGWVLVIGAGDREVPSDRFAALSARFGEAQAFVADREKSVYLWASYCRGVCRRAYASVRGQVLLDEEELTAEEIALGFGRFPRKNSTFREDYPDGDDVLAIAAAWGLDPMLEGGRYRPGVGWLCAVD